jgi:cation diffusion facilitator family transporter
MSAKPADSDHAYGHHKAEYFLTGVLIFVASLSILREAFSACSTPSNWTLPGTVLSSTALRVRSTGLVLGTHSRGHRSPALVADGRHLLTDVLTSGGVLVGVLPVAVTGWAVLDPVLAALVALNILWSGWQMLKDSVGGLMDAAIPPATLARVRELISANAGGAIEVHDLRTRHAGRRTFVDFHLVVPSEMSVSQSHEICDRIERAPEAEVVHPRRPPL